ncbi:XrtA/PEP-CTERM system-associated ATPase [Parasphingopyxis sp.]|uniref:XrtA/PEP-CTERM system-associated ATPase n=1 Tax=Parasphingopyxis sp. TaxID=1920299 RepID=UPI00261FDB6B|nr:XrtA/PEP-CTERM system-associated ATPase [Parasphingopyxis sp.]
MYSEHYGLTGNPFQLTPDPRFWFESETHKKAMAYLGYGLAQGEGFIVITGDIGAGKTTLVGHLMASIDTSRLTAVQVVSTQVEGDDMLRLVAQQLGLNAHGFEKAELLDQIERFLHGQAREGKRTLLIVDEAQNLSVSALEELRMLSNFQSAGRALLQIFLLGQPEFRDRVRKAPNLEQLRQRVIATHHLDPMHESEIEPYIVHRLAIAGWEGNPQFTPDAHAALYAATDGVPRRLNTLMARIMLFGAVEDLEVIDASAVNAVLADLAEDQALQTQDAPVAKKEPEPAASPVFEDAAEEEDEPEAEPDVYASLAAIKPREKTATEDRMPTAIAELPVEPVSEQEELEEVEPATQDSDSDARIAALEARVEEQEAALRRVLTLLIQWVEEDEDQRSFGVVSGDAA